MALPALSLNAGEQALHELMDDARGAMEDTMDSVRDRCRAYLNWYSPPWDNYLRRHDAWETSYDPNDDALTTRSNFTISRAVVDIWTALEAAKPPIPRAQPRYLAPSMPNLDQNIAALAREQYTRDRRIEAIRAEIRSRHFREYLRIDAFPLKTFRAVRRKNLYGFSWMMTTPDPFRAAPRSHVLRNPTTVYPLWSTRDPDELDAVLSVQQMSAVQANQRYELGLRIENGRVSYQQGSTHDRYSDVNDEWYYSEDRTKVWVEDFWWIEREYEDGFRVLRSTVRNVKRVCGRIVQGPDEFDWRYLPFVYWQNEDERHWSGWSEVANVMDINDDFNRRYSGEADVLGMYENPRFQLLGSYGARDDIEMPGGGELLTDLQDPERIEQILARIDVYPNQVHTQGLLDMLHRVSGLPPIVWGLIANAQTSGRALTASWKATEARLVPKIASNRAAIERYTNIIIDYARRYDWNGGAIIWEDARGTFDDIRWTFPPMEPRDFQEVTMDAITRRDAGLTTTEMAMRDTGEEDAEERLEQVKQENGDPLIHPDRAQALLLYRDAELQLMERLQAMAGQQQPQPYNQATVQQAAQASAAPGAPPAEAVGPGAEGPVPPSASALGAGEPPPPEETVTTGTLVRGGETSNQILRTTRVR